jgi:hypothetical protein
MTLILTPAYGRDYKNKKAVIADFENDKDFIINDIFGEYAQYDGKPINKSDILKQGTTTVNIRYQTLTKVLVHQVRPTKEKPLKQVNNYRFNTVGDLLQKKNQIHFSKH